MDSDDWNWFDHLCVYLGAATLGATIGSIWWLITKYQILTFNY